MKEVAPVSNWHSYHMAGKNSAILTDFIIHFSSCFSILSFIQNPGDLKFLHPRASLKISPRASMQVFQPGTPPPSYEGDSLTPVYRDLTSFGTKSPTI